MNQKPTPLKDLLPILNDKGGLTDVFIDALMAVVAQLPSTITKDERVYVRFMDYNQDEKAFCYRRKVARGHEIIWLTVAEIEELTGTKLLEA